MTGSHLWLFSSVSLHKVLSCQGLWVVEVDFLKSDVGSPETGQSFVFLFFLDLRFLVSVL